MNGMSDVDRMPQRLQSAFVESLAERRVYVNGASKIFEQRAHLELYVGILSDGASGAVGARHALV